MEIRWDRCAGIDRGKKSLVVCLLDGRTKIVRTYGTNTTAELRVLRDWLAEAGCQAVAMEATGSYWKPVWNVLEDADWTLLLANPPRIQAIPGRTSDGRDAEWIAELWRHGLIPARFVPDRPPRELRELTRYRTALVHDRAREVNRLAKVLEGGTIQLGSVLSDVTGKTGRAMLRALARGEDDRAALLACVAGPVKASPEALVAALTGGLTAPQRFMIRPILDGIESLEARIVTLEATIAEQLAALEATTALLETAPGIGVHPGAVCVAEIGVTVAAFPSAPTSVPGRASRPAKTRARASGNPRGRPPVNGTCGPCSSSVRGPRCIGATPIWRPNWRICSTAWARNARWWPSPIPCW